MMMEKLVERLAEETEIPGENLSQCRYIHHKPHMLPEANPGSSGGKPATNHSSYLLYFINTNKTSTTLPRKMSFS
jgi:hypothetical protein